MKVFTGGGVWGLLTHGTEGVPVGPTPEEEPLGARVPERPVTGSGSSGPQRKDPHRGGRHGGAD